jgi:opacity protein-like surface antigen
MTILKKLAIACTVLLPTTALADWNGYYGGVSTGQFSEGEFILEDVATFEIDDAETFGLFFGSMNQTGQLVYGVEFEFISAGEPEIQSGRGDVITTPMFDLKTRLGFALNDVLPYGFLGISSMSLDGPLSDDVAASGFNYGMGVNYLIGDKLIFGIEYLARRTTGVVQVDGFLGTSDIELNSDNVSIRAAYKF